MTLAYVGYSVRSDLNLSEERLIELTDSKYAVGVIDDEIIDNVSQEADGIIDAYVGGEYAIPVQLLGGASGAVPGIIRTIAGNIRRYLHYKRRDNMQMPEQVMFDYKWSLEMLQGFADGDYLRAVRVTPAVDMVGDTIGEVIADGAWRAFGRAKDSLA